MNKLIPTLIVVILAGALVYVYVERQKTPVVVPPIQQPTLHTYTDPQGAFSLKFPSDYVVDTSYTYDAAPARLIHGVKFTIPTSRARGTNLSTDSYVSIERIPNTTSCSAVLFFDTNQTAEERSEEGVTYSISTLRDAAAGNRYDVTVYALPGSDPCTAIRYFIHYGALQNYDPGAVTDFNEAQLTREFDAIRASFTLTPRP